MTTRSSDRRVRVMTPALLKACRASVALIAENRKKATHCRKGHKYTPESTMVKKNGNRHCRICMQANAKENREVRLRRLLARPHDPRHGTQPAWGDGCRCTRCYVAHAEFCITQRGKYSHKYTYSKGKKVRIAATS